MFQSRFTVVALGIMALLVAPQGALAQRGRNVVIKEPTGWFGVRISDQAMVDERGDAFFDSYPVVTHVDSGSPAAKAGVLPGDVLLTFNSHDMRGGSMALAKWLRVGAPFVLKIRRNDGTRVLRGKLDKRPDDWDQRMIVELSVPEGFEQRRGLLGLLQRGFVSTIAQSEARPRKGTDNRLAEDIRGQQRIMGRAVARPEDVRLPPPVSHVTPPFASTCLCCLGSRVSDAPARLNPS